MNSETLDFLLPFPMVPIRMKGSIYSLLSGRVTDTMIFILQVKFYALCWGFRVIDIRSGESICSNSTGQAGLWHDTGGDGTECTVRR